MSDTDAWSSSLTDGEVNRINKSLKCDLRSKAELGMQSLSSLSALSFCEMSAGWSQQGPVGFRAERQRARPLAQEFLRQQSDAGSESGAGR